MIVAGLTGGIASGKSTVGRFFADAGAIIVDADRIAREVVVRYSAAHAAIVAAFGMAILQPDGEIDRQRLGDIVFNAPEQRTRLNAIVHPHVFQRMDLAIDRAAERDPAAVVILDVPLLLETGIQRDLAEVIVVYIPEHLQLTRLMQRDGIGREAAMARIRAQMSIEEKRRQATVVIDNSGALEDTRNQAMAVFRRLAQRSGQRTDSV